MIRLRNLSYRFCPVFALILFCNNIAFAQTPQEQARQQNTSVIQDFEQEERFEQQQRIIEQEQETLSTDLQYQKSQIPPTGACVDVQNINLDGVTLVRSTTLFKNLQPFLKRCLYMSDIHDITQTINQLYIDRGYITSRSYLPAQDLSDGILIIKVVEGEVEDLQGSKNIKRQEVNIAFPDIVGQKLNLRDIEQGLDQINRLQSNNAKMTLEPGNRAGGSVISITNDVTKRWQVKTSIDNSGTNGTGILQGSVDYSYDNLLGLNDYASVGIKHDLNRDNRKQSKNITARYEIPYGYWNFHYALNYFDYISAVFGTAQSFKTEGSTRNNSIGFTRILHRDTSSKTTLNGGFTIKDSKNYLAGSRLDSSSQKISIANVGISHSTRIPTGFLYTSLEYNRGLDILGAHEDTLSGGQFAKGQFDNLIADVSLTKLFNAGWSEYNPLLETRAQAQLSPDTLFSSEQISIGGPFTVRGFKNQSISGDRGAYIVNTLSTTLPKHQDPTLNKVVGRIKPFVGLDLGAITSDSKNTFEGGRVSSWSLGLKNEGGAFDFDMTYSKPISAPSFVNKESEELFFKVSIKF